MLSRYTSPEVAEIFTEESRLEAWRRVEVAAAWAGAEEGRWPSRLATLVAEAPTPTPSQVAEVEATTRHEVVAFLLAWTADMAEEAKPIVHRGLTSSDVVDTGLSLQLVAASRLIMRQLDQLCVVLRDHALAHRGTLRLGRTHGQAATVEVWGHRVADFAFGIDRCRRRFADAADGVALVKLSGPTGGYHDLSPTIEQRVAATLQLRVPDVSTQVLMRDRLAAWIATMGITASVCEAVALDVRLGQHHGVAEVHEASGDAQAGSSSMPHKRNPITAERVCGLARLVRGTVLPVTEGIALWHERDLTHSSVERVVVPDAVALTDHVLAATTQLVANLHVDTTAMRSAVDAAGGATQTHLAVGILCDHGIGWPAAWRIVRDIATDTLLTRDEMVDRLVDAAPRNGTDWAVAFTGLAGADPGSVGGTDLTPVFERLAELPDQMPRRGGTDSRPPQSRRVEDRTLSSP